MNISSTGQATSAALLATAQTRQTAPSAQNSEEAKESPQERTKEAGKGESIDTHA